MKNITTVLACALLCAYGFLSGNIDVKPQNTITASENNSLASVLHPITKHDTVEITKSIRDTVVKKERVYVKVKQKERKQDRGVCATCDTSVENSVTWLKPREGRKGTPPDTLPARKRYEIHGYFEPMSEIR